ncbi:hypothetical protein DdX_19781 [Ditylenchus destructor]|uniref:Uncharacterized protein n=1 Tax=Ditylenchus destructor TaxID=166010 RepID=A0AAD4QX44_9BILA|nr:hypothetical protein DdX_19781 [Ditylenchus destructor]
MLRFEFEFSELSCASGIILNSRCWAAIGRVLRLVEGVRVNADEVRLLARQACAPAGEPAAVEEPRAVRRIEGVIPMESGKTACACEVEQAASALRLESDLNG